MHTQMVHVTLQGMQIELCGRPTPLSLQIIAKHHGLSNRLGKVQYNDAFTSRNSAHIRRSIERKHAADICEYLITTAQHCINF